MRTTINSVNLELSKEENIALLVEINQMFFENKPVDGIEKYPLLKRLEGILKDTHDVGEISSKSSTFKLVTRQ